MGRGRSRKTLALLAAAIEILEEIQPASVRAVCYQMFGQKLIRSMGREHIRPVYEAIKTAREDGTIPWEWIADDTRPVLRPGTWADPGVFAEAVTASYRRNKWAGQPNRVLLWSEKGTVASTIEPVRREFEVPVQIMRGRASATAVHQATMENLDFDKPTVILYVGDYDPSGMCMSERDLPKRLARYSSSDPSDRDRSDEEVAALLADAHLRIQRVALTAADCRAIGLAASFPATDKRTDANFAWFTRLYGPRCWELDAMSPVDLRARLRASIQALIEPQAWARYIAAEMLERDSITASVRTWRSVLNGN